MLTVKFWVYSKVLGREFYNEETHRSVSDARLRAAALGWTIVSITEV